MCALYMGFRVVRLVVVIILGRVGASGELL